MTRDDGSANPYYARMMAGPTGRFGAYLMERSFDPGMDSALGDLSGTWKDAEGQELSRRLANLTDDERDAVVTLARRSLVAALHGFLHGLSHDEDLVRLTFEGHDVAEHSDGLQGDLFFWLRDLARHQYDSDNP